MQLLDNDLLTDGLTGLERVKKIAEIKKSYEKMSSHIKQGRVAHWIIVGISFISLLFNFSYLDTFSILYSIGALAVFFIAAVAPFKYVKYAFGLSSLLYILSLVLTFTAFTTGIFLISLVVKSFVLFFFIRGFLASLKYSEITEQMKLYKMDIPE